MSPFLKFSECIPTTLNYLLLLFTWTNEVVRCLGGVGAVACDLHRGHSVWARQQKRHKKLVDDNMFSEIYQVVQVKRHPLQSCCCMQMLTSRKHQNMARKLLMARSEYLDINTLYNGSSAAHHHHHPLASVIRHAEHWAGHDRSF